MYNTLEEYLIVLSQRLNVARKSAQNTADLYESVIASQVTSALTTVYDIGNDARRIDGTFATFKTKILARLKEVEETIKSNQDEAVEVLLTERNILLNVLVDISPFRPKELSFTFHITFYPGAEATMCTGVNITAPSMGDAVRQWEEAHVNDGCILISAINLNVVPKYHLS